MLTIAIAKGRMQQDALALLARGGERVSAEALASRRLAVEDEEGRYRFVFVKPADVPVYVEHGIADCGVVGRDVLLESGADVLQPLDLKIAHCRIAVAARVGARLEGGGVLPVATKRTLEENGLVVVETITESTGRFVVNRASYQLKAAAVGEIVRALGAALDGKS